MTLETFFDKFNLFADAPGAVGKMRELVMQLAVQGKLVEQLSSDEPADNLLEKIRKTREQLINERAIRRQHTSPFSNDEAPFAIPASWVWTRLGVIGDWGSGSTPARGNHELYGGGIAWLKSGELNDNQTITGSEETVTELALKTCSFRRNQPGDVLLAMYGATIGKAAILAEPAVTNQAVCGCTPFEGVSNRYLFTFLLSQRAHFHSASEGGAQPNISKVKIIGFPFPLPPIAEQRRIVAKVDQLMALVDELEARLAASRTIAENLLAALVAELTGTTNDRNVAISPAEPAAPAPRPLIQPVSTAPIAPASPTPPPTTPAPPSAPKTARTLAELRKAAGLSQSAVAKFMSLNQAYISQMETGKRVITAEQRRQLAEILGVSADMIRV